MQKKRVWEEEKTQLLASFALKTEELNTEWTKKIEMQYEQFKSVSRLRDQVDSTNAEHGRLLKLVASPRMPCCHYLLQIVQAALVVVLIMTMVQLNKEMRLIKGKLSY